MLAVFHDRYLHVSEMLMYANWIQLTIQLMKKCLYGHADAGSNCTNLQMCSDSTWQMWFGASGHGLSPFKGILHKCLCHLPQQEL